jgi:hypothetical protein
MPMQAELIPQRTLDLQAPTPKPKKLSRKGIPTGAAVPTVSGSGASCHRRHGGPLMTAPCS